MEGSGLGATAAAVVAVGLLFVASASCFAEVVEREEIIGRDFFLLTRRDEVRVSTVHVLSTRGNIIR